MLEIERKVRRANKPHQCGKCWNNIMPGEEYWVVLFHTKSGQEWYYEHRMGECRPKTQPKITEVTELVQQEIDEKERLQEAYRTLRQDYFNTLNKVRAEEFGF